MLALQWLLVIIGIGFAFILLLAAIGVARILFHILIFFSRLIWKTLTLLTVLFLTPFCWIINSILKIEPRKRSTLHGSSYKGRLDRVSDADTIVINGKRIRIAFIDAPEKGQKTFDQQYDAGAIATKVVKDFLANAVDLDLEIIPIQNEHGDIIDRYGRSVAQIRVGSYDLGETIIGLGMAIALDDPKTPSSYHKAEQLAKRNKRGLWANQGFVEPKLHRIFTGQGIYGNN